jgi:hypothetical protein
VQADGDLMFGSTLSNRGEDLLFSAGDGAIDSGYTCR